MIQAIGSKKNLMEHPFYDYISDIIDNEQIQKLKEFTHHINTTRLQHSINVSYYNYLICNFFGFNAKSAARAGLLHDLFFYDRKKYNRQSGEKFHNSRHPRIAEQNARENFDLNKIEQDIILKHMWPMTLTPPKFKESYVIVLVDKYCAVLELFSPKYYKIKNKIIKKNKNG